MCLFVSCRAVSILIDQWDSLGGPWDSLGDHKIAWGTMGFTGGTKGFPGGTKGITGGTKGPWETKGFTEGTKGFSSGQWAKPSLHFGGGVSQWDAQAEEREALLAAGRS